jgi:flagellar biosynthesis/type III secretory pathway chaperone
MQHQTQAKPVSNRERVVQLIMMTESLADIIDQEVDLLSKRRPSSLAEFEQEKTRLAKVYANEMTTFRKDLSLTKDVPAGLLQDLKSSTARLRTKLDKQTNVLTGLRTVSEKMVQAIAKEVSKTRAPETAYGKNAVYNKVPNRGTALALNRTA